ncbi:MAG: response regulator [Actinobacteria bacterium]|nr:response regulator [Actinomycetota bacterium]
MTSYPHTGLDEMIEQRYRSLISLASGLTTVSDWTQLAFCLSHALGTESPVRIWAMLPDGPQEIVRYPGDQVLPLREARTLRQAGGREEPLATDDGFLLMPLRSVGSAVAIAEIPLDEDLDTELARHAAPLVASRAVALLASGSAGLVLAPSSDEEDLAGTISTFAEQARRLLDHDRLSAYLVTEDGKAVERFAVATSPTLPGEGVILPFAEFGLRHILLTNRALVSEDLGQDPRIVGREDRVIAQAGFHGLLSVPLRLNGRPFGVLNFVSRTSGFYREEDAPIAQQIADQASVFFDHMRRQRSARAWARHAVVERERERLARELHDTLTRALPDIARGAHGLAADLEGEDARSAEDIAEQAETALRETRRALADLLPPALESQNLEETIKVELSLLRENAGVAAELELTGDTDALPLGVRRAIYRIVQEALSNIRLHSGASRVDLSLQVDDDLKLTIHDDGKGLEPRKPGAGLGLRFMTERARALGGILAIEGAPGEGTTLTLELTDVRQLAESPSIDAGRPLHAEGGVSRRIFLIESHPLLLAGLTQIFEEQSDMRVVGKSRRGREAHRHVSRLRPDIVLLDADRNGAEITSLTRELKLASPTSEILVLSDYHQGDTEALLDAGAGDVIDKDLPRAEFIERIRATGRPGGDEPGVEVQTSKVLPGLTLSSRERAVLGLVAAGQTNAEIGKSLFLATKTIERHVATVIEKLGATNRAHAAALAVTHRLVRLDEPIGTDKPQ